MQFGFMKGMGTTVRQMQEKFITKGQKPYFFHCSSGNFWGLISPVMEGANFFFLGAGVESDSTV